MRRNRLFTRTPWEHHYPPDVQPGTQVRGLAVSRPQIRSTMRGKSLGYRVRLGAKEYKVAQHFFLLIALLLNITLSPAAIAQAQSTTDSPTAPESSPLELDLTAWAATPSPGSLPATSATAINGPSATVTSTPTIPTTPLLLPTPIPTLSPDLSVQQRTGIDRRIEQYLAQMTPADKVGQLFVITFQGDDAGATSDIAELIHNYRIGGVVISPERGNFTNARGPDTPADVAALTNQLQALSYGIAVPTEDALNRELMDRFDQTGELPEGWQLLENIDFLPEEPTPEDSAIEGEDGAVEAATDESSDEALSETETPETETPETGTALLASTDSSTSTVEAVYNPVPLRLPLLIGVEQLGDGLPYTALRSGFTSLPSQMALGAAWDPALTEDVGEIVGRELNAVGVNMLLGPNLDVFDQSRTDAVGSLGIYSFGGSSYWVGRHGQAYIAGVHAGGRNRVITIARHFPGQGDSDRLPTSEIATIQNTLDELERTDLPPFTSVTRNNSIVTDPAGNPATTDGLMTSHMRYSAIQGPVLETGPVPLSLDPRLVSVINNGLSPDWRAGGLIMSNELGSPAIRRNYAAPSEEFPARKVALEAFYAGHDLLYLAQFGNDDTWESEKQNLINTIDSFRSRYESDSDFAAQVNYSVARILRVKLYMYTNEQATLAEAAAAQTAALGQAEAGASATPQPVVATPITTAGSQLTETLTSELPITDSITITSTLDPVEILSNTLPISLTQAISVGQVLVSPENLNVLAEGSEAAIAAEAAINQVARDAATFLSPTSDTSNTAAATAPQSGDNILIFTNSRLQSELECEQCVSEVYIRPTAIEDIIIELYGVSTTDLISDVRVTSRSFAELSGILSPADAAIGSPQPTAAPGNDIASDNSVGDASPEMESAKASDDASDGSTPEQAESILLDDLTDLEQQIVNADWIIFAMLDINTAADPNSDVLKRFLSQRYDQVRDKNVFVFSFNAPYFLDATEISRLTAYYGMYSKTHPSLESAVRALFNAFTPEGTAPVSVPGTQFTNLTEQLLPDPSRPPDLEFQLDGVPVELDDENENAGIAVEVGQALRIEVGPVLDHNGHQVPDNTSVQIQFDFADPVSDLPAVTVPTRGGMASHDLLLDIQGDLTISAIGGVFGDNGAQGATSNYVTFNIRQDPEQREAASNATATAEALLTMTTTTEAGEVVPANLDGTPVEENAERPAINVWTLVIALLTIMVMLSLLVILQVRIMERTNLVRNLLWATIVGLFAYILYGVGMMPGSTWLQDEAYPWGTSIIVFVAMLLPLLWLQLTTE